MPRAFSRFLLAASLLTVLLAACVSQPADGGQPTATPTPPSPAQAG